MKREFTLILDGTEYPVIAEGGTITVNGRPFAVEIEDDQVLVDSIAYDVALENKTAHVGDQAYALEVSGLAMNAGAPAPAPSAPAAVEAGAGSVVAIMPGKIVRILVEEGQEVEEGQPVCVLEAMKMENELNARQAGVVKEIYVQPGQDVEKDQVLVEIE